MKSKKLPLLTIFCCIFFHNLFSQPAIQWQNTIGGISYDYAKVIRPVSGGGYIIGGTSKSGISGDKTEANIGEYDYWILKLNSNGGLTWQNTIGGSGDDYLTDVQPTSDGGYIVAGHSQSGISGDKNEANFGGGPDYWIVKLSSSGTIEWQNTIGGTDSDELMAIQQTSDGGYILGGSSESPVSGDKTEASINGYDDYWIVKLSSTGIIQWQNTIGGNEDDLLRTIHQTPDGGYFIGGYSKSGISGDKTEPKAGLYDYWVVKLNSTGNIVWQNSIVGSDWDILTSAALTSDGGYILGGYSDSGISDDKTETALQKEDYWVVKINSVGSIEWQNSIGGDGHDYLRSLQQTMDGGYILGGSSSSGISGDKTESNWATSEFWIVKLNSSGMVEWDKTILGNDSPGELECIGETPDGGYIICGSSDSDYRIMKLAPCTSLLQYADTDGDGFGDPYNAFFANDCSLHDGFVFNKFDCNDANAAIHPAPGAFEIANGLDDDCNDVVDDVVCTNEGSPEIQWQQAIGGVWEDVLATAHETEDGGYILGGSSQSGISGDKTEANFGYYDYWILKTDASGNIEWQRTLGGKDVDYLKDIRQTADGGYIAGGTSSSDDSGNKSESNIGLEDYWIVKLSSSGIIEWQTVAGGNGSDRLCKILQTNDGGYLAGGSSESGISGNKTENSIGKEDYWVIKLNAAGVIEWQNTVGGSKIDELFSLEQTADGGYMLGGTSSSTISGDKTEAKVGEEDYWVVKLNSTGNIEWQNTIGSKDSERLASVVQTSDGGYLLAGRSEGAATGDKTEASEKYDYWIVQLNSSGEIQWQNTIGGNEDDYLFSAAQTTDEGFILGGISFSPVSGDKTVGQIGFGDYWILKLYKTGNIEWQKTIGGIDAEDLSAVQQTSTGGFLLGGTSASGTTGCKTEANKGLWNTKDYWPVKLFPLVAIGCPLPQSVMVENITDTKAMVSWTGNPSAFSYRIRKRLAGTGTWIYSSVTAPTTSKQLSGNIPDTEYEVQVQTYCNPEKTDSSGYTPSVFFTSDTECPKPKSVLVSEISDDKATVSWVGNEEAYSYRIRKRATGTVTWIYSSVLAPLTSKTLSNNIPGTEYEVQVQTYCDTAKTDSSGYTGSLLFTSGVACLGTATQSTTNITSTKATISWTFLNEPSKWIIKSRLSGSNWKKLTIDGISTDAALFLLSPSSDYDWKIRADCGSQKSNWSPIQHFTTLPARLAEEIKVNTFSIYPNPAKEVVSIQVSGISLQLVSIKVYDVSGKEMATWFNGQLDEGDHTLSFDVSSFAKGIYFVRMISENGIQNQKLIVQ